MLILTERNTGVDMSRKKARKTKAVSDKLSVKTPSSTNKSQLKIPVCENESPMKSSASSDELSLKNSRVKRIKPNIKRIKPLWKFIKIAVASIIGFIAYIVTISDLRKYLENDLGFVVVSLAILISIFLFFFVFYVLLHPVKFRQLFRYLSIALLSVLIIGWVSYGIYSTNQEKIRKGYIVILVADFFGPEQDNYQITMDMISKMKLAFDKNNIEDTKVEALGQIITETNGGSKLARDLGKKKSADLVIWGRYSVDENDVFLDIYVENLSDLEYLTMKKSTFTEDSKIVTRDKFEFRQELSQEMSAFALFVSALGHYEKSDFSVAYNYLNLALAQNQWNELIISKKYPLNFRALSRLALNPTDSKKMEISDKDKIDDGIKDMQAAIKISPDDPSLYFDLAFIYMVGNQLDQAIENYEKAIEYDPNNLEALNNLGITYYLNGRLDDAKNVLLTVVQQDPKYVLAWHQLGNVYEGLGESEKAVESYSKALETNPNYSAALNDRGVLYGKMQKYNEAERDFDLLIKIEPSEPLAYYNRSKVYFDLKKWPNAIDDLTKAIRLDQKSCQKPVADCITPLALYDRALSYWGFGNTDAAIKDFDQLLSINKNNADAYWQRGGLYISLGNISQGFKDYDDALIINPNHTAVLYNRGSEKAKLRDFNGAIIDLTKAIENAPDFTAAYYNRGLAYVDSGQFDKAIPDLKKVIELNSDSFMLQESQRLLHELGVNP